MAVKTKDMVAISIDGVVANCQRRLAFKGQQIRRAKGRFFLFDVLANKMIREIHDLEAFAKKLGALSPWKTVKVPQTV